MDQHNLSMDFSLSAHGDLIALPSYGGQLASGLGRALMDRGYAFLGERREATFVVSLLINKSRLLAKSYAKQEQVHEMPIGLEKNYVVFRKDRLEVARAVAFERNDAEVVECPSSNGLRQMG
jgi:hypothetical protein